MDRLNLIEIFKTFGGETEITEGKQFIEISVPPANLHNLCEQLFNNEKTKFDFLYCLSGVDYGKELGVVYHLRSTVFGHSVVVKTRTDNRDKPVLDSVCDIWKTADFHEREVYDLLGIRFNNHPDLRRLFLDSSWGYPLRKDYVDDVNIVTK